MRVALASMVSKTGSSSPVELEMTCSTSEVAVCCCSDSRSSFSSRVFSIAITAWYDQNGASAGYLGQGNRRWLAFDVGLLQSEVGDVLQLLGRDNAAERIVGAKADYRLAPPQRVPFQRRALHRDDAERVSVVQ